MPEAAVLPTEASEASEAIPEPRTDSPPPASEHGSQAQQAHRVPFDRPAELAMLLNRMVKTDDAFFTLLEIPNREALDRDPARLGELARSFAEQAAAQPG
ncbi:hypothetical protein [Streptomyces acidicola]|uniref:hypothetical protein n=1 Tax=Streptomyces acidicola TaxID=2596892 RepID=UPI003417AC84